MKKKIDDSVDDSFFANAISFVAEQFEQLIDFIGRDATLSEDTNIELMDLN